MKKYRATRKRRLSGGVLPCKLQCRQSNQTMLNGEIVATRMSGGVSFSNAKSVYPINVSNNARTYRKSRPVHKTMASNPRMTPNLAKKYANYLVSHGNNFNTLFEGINHNAALLPAEKHTIRQKLLYNYQPSGLSEKEDFYFSQLMWLVNTPSEMDAALDKIHQLTEPEKDNIYDMYIWHLANHEFMQGLAHQAAVAATGPQ